MLSDYIVLQMHLIHRYDSYNLYDLSLFLVRTFIKFIVMDHMIDTTRVSWELILRTWLVFDRARFSSFYLLTLQNDCEIIFKKLHILLEGVKNNF